MQDFLRTKLQGEASWNWAPRPPQAAPRPLGVPPAPHAFATRGALLDTRPIGAGQGPRCVPWRSHCHPAWVTRFPFTCWVDE